MVQIPADHAYFNPRTREGYDKNNGSTASYVLNFNPRTREGYD